MCNFWRYFQRRFMNVFFFLSLFSFFVRIFRIERIELARFQWHCNARKKRTEEKNESESNDNGN